MIKTIKINKESSLTISNNLSWAMAYKDQFGHDIVPDIMPLISALTKLMSEMIGKDIADAIKNIDPDTLNDALVELCALQFVDFINLVWAMAKANDDNIDPPEVWIRQFDEFPVDVIGPAVFELLTKGLISSKNLKSLRTIPKAE